MRKKGEEDFDSAAIVTHGVYQYVRLPKELRFEGDRILIKKLGNEVILKPLPGSSTKPAKRTGSK